MNKMFLKIASVALLGFVLAQSVFALEIEKKNFQYGKDPEFEGYLAYPKSVSKKTPAILVIHNWMGLTDQTREAVDRLAGLGYIAMAADVYGKGQRPNGFEQAGQFATKYKTDRKLFRERLNAALSELKKQKNVDTNKIAALGYCFGGTGAIELARSGADLKGIVSFHGGLDSPTPVDGQKIKGKLIAFHGAIDPFVPAKDVDAFEQEMQTAKVDYQLIKYGGVVHSFTEKAAGDDIKKGFAYNKQADERSFEATKLFLKEIF